MSRPEPPASLDSPFGRVCLILPPDNGEWDEAVARLQTHPRTRQYLRFLPEIWTKEDARKKREAQAKDSTMIRYLILAKNENSDDALAGTTGVFNMADSATEAPTYECAITVDPEWHGKGIAGEGVLTLLDYVFKELGIHRVSFMTGDDNTPMRSFLEQIGATFEGTFRDLFRDGPITFSNAVQYSILRPEWELGVREKMSAKIKRALQM